MPTDLNQTTIIIASVVAIIFIMCILLFLAVYFSIEEREDENSKMHYEKIKCIDCNHEQIAEVQHTWPWWSYVHTCTRCGYVIMESEWEKIKN